MSFVGKFCLAVTKYGLRNGLAVRAYARNPIERRTGEELVKTASGRTGGRKGRGKRGGRKKEARSSPFISLGKGAGGKRWPGLSFPLGKTTYGPQWMEGRKLNICQVEMSEDEKLQNRFLVRELEGERQVQRKVSEMNWSAKGWSGRQWGGRYVGCPEAPDGTPLTEFRSTAIKVKRVANQTAGGKKRTVSALVVVGNGNGAVGFAVGKAEEIKPAIRKAKNKAVNYLHFIPRCDGHTVYHNIQTKFKKTKVEMERRVKGSGLRCQRAIAAVCNLAGIKDMRAKITGSANPLNVIRATFKGLTSQETYQDLADKNGMFVVEYRRECHFRPIVVAIPQEKKTNDTLELLKNLQLVPKEKSVSSL